jgi:hypothetical protein
LLVKLLSCRLWNLAIAPLTSLTELTISLPLLLSPATAEQLVLPSTLQQLRLHLQHSDAEQQAAEQQHALTGLAAGQLLLGSLPPLPQLTQLVLKAISPNDWFAAPDAGLSNMATAALGQLTNLRSLSLLVGHWQLSLLQLQPLSACVHLTSLVLSELVMGYSGEGQDDQSGSRLTPEEAAAVAAGVAAAAAGTEAMRKLLQEQQGGSEQQQEQQALQQEQDNDDALWQLLSPRAASTRSPGWASRPSSSCSFVGEGASRRSSCGGAASSDNMQGPVPVTMRVAGNSVKVPLLPQLQVLRCTTLWWRLPLVRVWHVLLGLSILILCRLSMLRCLEATPVVCVICCLKHTCCLCKQLLAAAEHVLYRACFAADRVLCLFSPLAVTEAASNLHFQQTSNAIRSVIRQRVLCAFCALHAAGGACSLPV